MRLYQSKIWYIFLSLLLSLLLEGCNWHADPSLWEENLSKEWDGDLFLKLNVTVAENGMESFTRALGTEDYFEEPTLETEKLQTLRVIIIKEKKKSEDNDTITYNRTYNSLYSLSNDRFEVEFSTTYRIYLIGNEAGLEGLIRKESDLDVSDDSEENDINFNSFIEGEAYITGTLENLEFCASVAASPILINNTGDESEKKPIPMTEIFSVTTQSRPDSSAEVIEITRNENLFITRTASKFSFVIKNNPEQTNVNYGIIKYIRITGLRNKEYLFPNGTKYDPEEGSESFNDFGGREITDFNELTTVSSDYFFSLPDYTLTSEHKFAPELYFPESKGGNVTDTSGIFKCSISYDGETYLELVNLPNLTSLPRNTHVKVIISISGNKIEATATVLPYTGVNLNPTFGIDRD